jgi:uncharacterized membrane protein YbaN (DUF454 family)
MISDGVRRLTRSIGNAGNAADGSTLEIEIDAIAGLLRVRDGRIFRLAERSLCASFAAEAIQQRGVCKVEIDLPTRSCVVRFIGGTTSDSAMAEAFVESLGRAVEARAKAARKRQWRGHQGWHRLTAFPGSAGMSLWESIDLGPGRVDLRRSGSANSRVSRSKLLSAVAQADGVAHCRAVPWTDRVIVELSPGRSFADTWLDDVERILAQEHASDIRRNGDHLPARRIADPLSGEGATGLARLKYTVFAGGSFGLTLLGIVVPGIPTLPFLVATSYYVTRISPRYHAYLRQSFFFGEILEEWETKAALSVRSKGKLFGLTIAIIVISLGVFPATPISVAVVLVLSTLSLYEVLRMPSIPSDASPEIDSPNPRRVALPAT